MIFFLVSAEKNISQCDEASEGGREEKERMTLCTRALRDVKQQYCPSVRWPSGCSLPVSAPPHTHPPSILLAPPLPHVFLLCVCVWSNECENTPESHVRCGFFCVPVKAKLTLIWPYTPLSPLPLPRLPDSVSLGGPF